MIVYHLLMPIIQEVVFSLVPWMNSSNGSNHSAGLRTLEQKALSAPHDITKVTWNEMAQLLNLILKQLDRYCIVQS